MSVLTRREELMVPNWPSLSISTVVASFLGHHERRVLHFNVIEHRTGVWTAQ
jgi:hypothetical protein